MKCTHLACLLLLLTACGPEESYRPLEIEIYGVSARAATVNLKLFTLEKPAKCNELDREKISSADSYVTEVWDRESAIERSWSIPPLQDESVTMVVYTSSEDEQVLQYLCREITYVGVGENESGVLNVTLPARQAP